MATERGVLLPLHDFLSQMEAWQTDSSPDQLQRVRASVARIAVAYGASGVLLEVALPPLAPLSVGSGTLEMADAADASGTKHDLDVPAHTAGTARLVVDGEYAAVNRLIDAFELSLSALWSLESAHAQRAQLEALDVAVGAIAGIAPVDRVLQLIVDRVRDLVGSQYAALGIVGPFGQIEEFIVSGISDELRAKLGPPPRGHGLLGLIIRENRALVIDDIETDARRYGFPNHHPEMHSLLGVPVRSKGETIGNLYLTNKLSGAVFADADLRLVERFALHAGIAIENARLHDEIGRLAIVDERQRISADLHDSIIQNLYGISLSLEDLPDVIAADPDDGAARTDRAIDAIHSTIRDIRNFIMGLQPELLSDDDFATALRKLAAEFEANTLIDTELTIDTDASAEWDPATAQLVSIAREALSNVARHSGATRAFIDVAGTDDTLRLLIRDNGRGFDVSEERGSEHRGLANLQTRAQAIGGEMTVTSSRGSGTCAELIAPRVRRKRLSGDSDAPNNVGRRDD
jgi:signal transduction histidine kinase